jgi:hypothetical protein
VDVILAPAPPGVVLYAAPLAPTKVTTMELTPAGIVKVWTPPVKEYVVAASVFIEELVPK